MAIDKWLAGDPRAHVLERFNYLMNTRRNLLEAKAALVAAFNPATGDRLNPEIAAVNAAIMGVLQEIEAGRGS